ncbi:hypothetical protein TrLO_g9412 [Triparma laevis f. longispina]|uniref:Protein arginine N-methyltransferase n=1 Tax=Triparma laevis f. longispina TaxID=1714387 RepID=A0A9W7DPQ3_9STRA|nr:hypothetical protein TrLO_g9412 [Triparma laevis f. longispina]
MNSSMLSALNLATSADVLTFCIESTEITLFPTLDMESGGLRWVQDVSDGAAILRHLSTKKWLIPMLLDTPRNSLYSRAISQAIPNTECTSLDIGTGTGLLAMLTARGGNVKVLSLEMSEAMAGLAKNIVASNDLEERISIRAIHSTALQTTEGTPNLCTSELLDYQLIGEGIIPTLRDLYQRSILKPSTVVIPSNGQIYARLISLKEIKRYGSYPDIGVYENVQFGEYGEERSHRVLPYQGLKMESEFVSSIFEPFKGGFVFDSEEMIPGPEGRESSVGVEVESDCVVGGVFFWWELELLKGSGLKYSTEYGKQQFQDHWPGSLYVLPESSRISVKSGEEVEVKCEHDDGNIWFTTVKSSNDTDNVGNKRFKSDGVKIPPELPTFSAARMNMLNCTERAKFFNGLLDCVQGSSRVLDVSDFCLLGLIAKSKAGSVTSLESCDPKLALHSATVAQVHNGVSPEKFSIVNCGAVALQAEHLVGGEKVDLIVGECWYEKMGDNVILCALNFHYVCRGLLERGIGVESCAIFPSMFRIMAVAIQFNDGMQNAYKNVKEVEGFDHGDLDVMGADNYENFDLGIDLFSQYYFDELCEPTEVCKVGVGVWGKNIEVRN